MPSSSSSINDTTLSMQEVIDEQDRLREQAAEAIPFSFSQCTYGSTEQFDRQPIYSCLSCRPQQDPYRDEERAGLCAGCSVACHGDCELVELFTRRDFVCDCGTSKLKKKKKCTLSLRYDEKSNESNKYDKNFDGLFCSCMIRYDPETEEDEMIQCLICEDWFHTAKCLSFPAFAQHPDSFDHLVCEACVLSKGKKTIGRYAGSPKYMLQDQAVRELSGRGAQEQTNGNQSISSNEINSQEQDDDSIFVTAIPAKRSVSPGGQDSEPPSKKAKIENHVEISDSCKAPPERNPLLEDGEQGARNVYLVDGWREIFCRCPQCLALYDDMPYLLEEESVYEPPDDPDSEKTLEELGTNALMQLPREQAIQGVVAYNSMRDKLKAFFEPFAKEGKVVSKEDVDQFFRDQKEEQK